VITVEILVVSSVRLIAIKSHFQEASNEEKRKRFKRADTIEAEQNAAHLILI
jgi:hypothetical protein